MFAKIVRVAFDQFDRNALTQDENDVLDGGIVKHISVLRMVAFFAIPQAILAYIAPEIFILLSAVSFVSMMLGTAWYAISFQNVSMAQLIAGVADFITKKMFRSFMITFTTLIICAITFVVKTMLPELTVPKMVDLPLWFRIPVLLANMSWLVLVWFDVYWASVGYDGADSLLGDGFPTVMRGATASHQNRDTAGKISALAGIMSAVLAVMTAMAEKQGVDVDAVLEQAKKPE